MNCLSGYWSDCTTPPDLVLLAFFLTSPMIVLVLYTSPSVSSRIYNNGDSKFTTKDLQQCSLNISNWWSTTTESQYTQLMIYKNGVSLFTTKDLTYNKWVSVFITNKQFYMKSNLIFHTVRSVSGFPPKCYKTHTYTSGQR